MTADHESVKVLEPFHAVLVIQDIAISKKRDLQVILKFINRFPVSDSFKSLAVGPAMDGNH